MRTTRRTFIRTAACTGAAFSFSARQLLAQAVLPSASPGRIALLTDAPYPSNEADDIFTFSTPDCPAFRAFLNRSDIRYVLVHGFTGQRSHLAAALMKAGKESFFTGPFASSLPELQSLAAIHRQTGTPCYILDEDGYAPQTQDASALVDSGFFGDLTHVHCGSGSQFNGLGPALRWLKINRDNQLVSLTACLSRSWGLHVCPSDAHAEAAPLEMKNYALGEVLTVTLQCANGASIAVSRDLAGYRPYSRGYRVQGTAGLWIEENNTLLSGGQPVKFPTLTPECESASALNTPVEVQNRLLTDLSRGAELPFTPADSFTLNLIELLAQVSLNEGGRPVSGLDLLS